MDAKVRDNGGVDFINEGRGARLRVFAALKHRFMKQVLQASPVSPASRLVTHWRLSNLAEAAFSLVLLVRQGLWQAHHNHLEAHKTTGIAIRSSVPFGTLLNWKPVCKHITIALLHVVNLRARMRRPAKLVCTVQAALPVVQPDIAWAGRGTGGTAGGDTGSMEAPEQRQGVSVTDAAMSIWRRATGKLFDLESRIVMQVLHRSCLPPQYTPTAGCLA